MKMNSHLAPRRKLHLSVQAGLPPERDDPHGKESAALFELVEAWALEDHDDRK